MSDQPNSNTANNTTGNPRHRYWCHQCQSEINALMAPRPTCNICHLEFVEEIEGDNDPREFVGGHEHETDDEFEEFNSAPNMPPGQNAPNDVVHLLHTMLQTIVGPNVPLRVETRTYGDNNEGGTTTTTTTATITTDDGTTTTTTYNNDSSGDQRQNFFFMGTGNQPNPSNGQEGADDRNPMHALLQLLQRTFGEAGQQNPNWVNFLNMVGDPRDYVWGPGGLDNIISQLMEQTAERQAPPPATDEIIDNLPKVTISKKQVAEEQLNCPVCKDDFNEDETATLLPCKHTFHDECIRPWLKVNGTCPVCRYSLVPQEENVGDDQNRGGGSGNNSNGNFNIGSFNGNFVGNPPSSSSQSSARLNLPGSYPSTQQQNGQQNRQNEEQQNHDMIHEPLD